MIRLPLARHAVFAFSTQDFAIEKGRLDKGFLPIGQVTGLIHDEPTVEKLMERMVAEARTAHSRLSVIMNKS
jgi:NAD(P)H-dependent flavin oxidoreductase YrpB (nitropropane dioxygenase family)